MDSRIMKLQAYVLIALFLLVSLKSEAQNFQKTYSGAKSIINSPLRLKFSSIIRQQYESLKSPQGKTYSKKSLSVVEIPQKTTLSIRQFGDELVLEKQEDSSSP